MIEDRLSLTKARKLDRLDDFTRQQEALYGPINPRQFDLTVKKAVTEPKSQGQTSGSRVRGGSSGK